MIRRSTIEILYTLLKALRARIIIYQIHYQWLGKLQSPIYGEDMASGIFQGVLKKKQDAILKDNPSIGSVDVSKSSAQIFETAALAIKGNQKGTYYGSVQWGWQTDAAGNHSKLPFNVISQGVPTSTFMKSAEIWNASKSASGEDTLDLPIVDVKVISNPAGVNIGLGPVYTNLPMGTRVVEMPGFPSMTETYIRVVDGPYTGETGKVNNSDYRDERN